MAAQVPVPCIQTPFRFGDVSVALLIPDAAVLNARHVPDGAATPYWARLWPASVGLCMFLAERPELVAGKRVLELAAGLGLPGMVAAHWAQDVTLSDIDPDAVTVMQAAIGLNGLQNVCSRVVDWSAIPDDIQPEIVLLSDVNYDPGAFETLFRVLSGFLQSGIPVLLSTPQRLMAKPFIGRLLPWCREQREVALNGAFVTVFVLG